MVEGAVTPTSIADDDRLDAAFLYSFANAASGAPHGRRERFVEKPESESDFDCYSSNLPDRFILSRTMALYRLIAEGRFDFEYDKRVHLLANACERLENADPPSLKELFKICFGDDKYDPRARARLAALPLIFVVQPREARGGLEQIVYPRPQGGDSDIYKFVRTVAVLTRKTLAASQRCALSGTHLKGILKLTNNANLRRKIKSAVIEASGLSNAAANKHFSVSLSDKDKMEVYAKLEELAEIDSEYQRLAECKDKEFF